MADTQGRLDGLAIEVYDGRFGGTFEMDKEIGQNLAFDDVVTFFVTAVTGKSNFGANKSGDLKRTNVFEVSEVAIVPNELASKVANELNIAVDGVNYGQMELGGPDPTAKLSETLAEVIADADDDVFTPPTLPSTGEADWYDDEGWTTTT
jgi:hypothetical protein